MGLLDRLFKTDPRQALERAEGLLARGDAAKALRLAQRAADGGSLAQNTRAEQIIRRAREALAGAVLDKAALSEEAGFYEDAAEWISAALEHVDDEGRRDELERRVEELLARATEQDRQREAPAFPDFPDDEETPEPVAGELELDPEEHYETLVSTLDDDVAARYETRPEEFRRAFVQLNEGQVQEALEALEALAESWPEDPVYHLERGRCHLLLGHYEEARRDLEAVWEAFGDEPLDHSRSVSVPGLWAEAMLGLEQPAEVVERLDEVALPQEADPGLCYYYALALMVTKSYDRARSYLLAAITSYPQNPEFPHQLAAALHQGGRTGEAIDTLERAIAPSCSPAGCRRVALHLPSLRSLAGLYLGADGALERVHELLTLIAQAQGGRLAGEDYLLVAEYHQQRGDDEAASEAAAQARTLKEASAAATASSAAQPPPLPPPGRRGPLL